MINNNYTVEDLIADNSFLAFVYNTDEQSVRYWQKWIDNHLEQSDIIGEATLIAWSLTLKPCSISEETINQELGKLKSSLAESKIYSLTPPASRKRLVWRGSWQSVAATVLFFLTTILAIWLYSRPFSEIVIFATKTDSPSMLLLPDSSLVFLSSNSTIRYNKNWQEKAVRKVWLEGEAFFHVKPKPVINGIKFQVYAGQVTVEVVGTRFNVLNRNDKINVVLTSGKVNFKIKKGLKEKEIALRPGDMISITRNSLSPKKKKINVKKFPVLKEEKILFENTSIRKIVLLLREQFGINVRLQDSTIADLRVSGSFPLNSEKVFLKTLAVVLNLHIERGNNEEVFFRYK